MTSALAVRMRWAMAAAAIAGPMVYPAAASAHAGQSHQVATSFLAQVSAAPAGIDVRVIDGDQRLWMRVDPKLTVIVVGLLGEPYLRFSPTGVDENLRSPTTYQNQTPSAAVPKGAGANLAASWRHLTDGHTYTWHEDRLHTLALAARHPASGAIGPWTVPLNIDGHKAAIDGRLSYAAAPSKLWFWPALVILACAIALIRIGDPRITRRLATLLALVTVLAVLVGRVGRELYGRPHISPWQMVDLGITCLLAALAMMALLRTGEARLLICFVVGVAGIYQGLVLLPALTHGYVLVAIPTAVERLAASVSIAAGIGALLPFLFGDVSPAAETPHSPPRAIAETGTAPL